MTSLGLTGTSDFSNCSSFTTNTNRWVDRCIYVTNNVLNQSYPTMTNKWMCIPSFIIIGTMKSGTGELMRWLNLHPLMQSGSSDKGRRKEVHFFGSANFDQSTCPLLDYIHHFSVTERVLSNARQGTKSKPYMNVFMFDKSPNYIRDKHALKQMHAIVPDAKLLVILRNPVDRAYSEFRHHCLRNRYRRLITANDTTISVECSANKVKSNSTTTTSVDKNFAFEGKYYFQTGSIVRKEIVGACRVESVERSSDRRTPMSVQELERILEPLNLRRCSYADFAAYYFGPKYSTNNSNTVFGSVLDGWAKEEYTHGLYHEQIQRVLQWYSYFFLQ